MTDTEELNKLIKKAGFKKSYIAEQCGITRQSLNAKISNRSAFTAKEISMICRILKIDSLRKKEKLFFVHEVE